MNDGLFFCGLVLVILISMVGLYFQEKAWDAKHRRDGIDGEWYCEGQMEVFIPYKNGPRDAKWPPDSKY